MTVKYTASPQVRNPDLGRGFLRDSDVGMVWGMTLEWSLGENPGFDVQREKGHSRGQQLSGQSGVMRSDFRPCHRTGLGQ